MEDRHSEGVSGSFRRGVRLHRTKNKTCRGFEATTTTKGLPRLDLAAKLPSSQSRVAKMVAGDPSVSLDLLIRSLISLGTTERELYGSSRPRTRIASKRAIPRPRRGEEINRDRVSKTWSKIQASTNTSHEHELMGASRGQTSPTLFRKVSRPDDQYQR